MKLKSKPTFLEFFAGGGMARLGLGRGWECLLANDFDRMKAKAYRTNFPPAQELRIEDIRRISSEDIPRSADLAWASFPCQDLSLAGNLAGLEGPRSGTFWSFSHLIADLVVAGKAPSLLVLENVYGTLTSRKGQDFRAIISSLTQTGYRSGALVIDAIRFLPQSRARLFIIAVRKDLSIPRRLVGDGPVNEWHSAAVVRAYESLDLQDRANWIWWTVPVPAKRPRMLLELIEESPTSVTWHTPNETEYILSLMSEANIAKLSAAKRYGKRVVGTIYRRTRTDSNGARHQRAEVRFDGVAGCLRTPGGGSSRQVLIIVEGQSVRTRLLSTREAARLMGIPDGYTLPPSYNDAYKLAGDGVAVPVVKHLTQSLLRPLAVANRGSRTER